MTYKKHSNKKHDGKEYAVEVYHTSGQGYILSVNEGIYSIDNGFTIWQTILFEDFCHTITFLKGGYSAKKMESFHYIVDNVLTVINKLIDEGQDITKDSLKLIMNIHSNI